MPNWGKVEHKTEIKVILMLLIAVGIAVLFVWLRIGWLAYVLSAWIFLTFLLQIQARFAHFMEKRHWAKSKWSPRGGYKKK